MREVFGCPKEAPVASGRAPASSWDPIPGNPLPWIQAPDRDGGHGNIIRQIRQAVAHLGDWSWDVICFLEQDVLYPADYFERVGAAFAATPEANVVSNLDYEGLNATGWLAVKERHEPMHQLSMRRLFALANLDRAESDCTRQGWAYLEPQGDRSDWLRLPATGKSPSIHVNHAKRFTSHGEVCYEAESSRRQHPVWGKFRRWWPLEPSLPDKIWSAARALRDFVADGCGTVTREEYATRLTLCDACPDRDDTRCRLCGCQLALKARGRTFRCPAGKW